MVTDSHTANELQQPAAAGLVETQRPPQAEAMSYWQYDSKREAPWWVWTFVIAYSGGVILFLVATV